MYLACPSWHPDLLHKRPDWRSGRERERVAGGRLQGQAVTPGSSPPGWGGCQTTVPRDAGPGRGALCSTWQVCSHASCCLPGFCWPCLPRLPHRTTFKDGSQVPGPWALQLAWTPGEAPGAPAPWASAPLRTPPSPAVQCVVCVRPGVAGTLHTEWLRLTILRG